MKKSLSILLILGCFCFTLKAQKNSNNLKIWFTKPAKQFEEALPLGNGRLGAMVYGGVETERLSLNEGTLWSGGPIDPNVNPKAKSFLKPVRDALFSENYKTSDSLLHFMQGKYSESYAPLGNLFIDFKAKGTPSSYRRELDLNNATSKVSYTINGTQYTRETFISYPSQLVVMRLKAVGKDKLNFTCRFNSLLQSKVSNDKNTLLLNGFAPIHTEPNYRGNLPNAVVNDTTNAMRFSSQLKVLKTDGKQAITGQQLKIENATEAIIIISMATSYNGYDKNPGKDGKNEVALAKNYLNQSAKAKYEVLLTQHQADYKKYFDRVKIDLGENENNDLTTLDRLSRFATGKTDNALVALYYQFSRYLLISSSRPGSVPANLQGIWNEQVRPPWSSNYTTNINAEMNYWGVEVANLSEFHTPLLDFIGRLAKTGSITANNFYGAGGWVCHHNSDIWALTNPVGDFGEGSPSWANWPMGGTWLSTHLYEHYAFTLDKNYLQNQAYPLLKGATQFCLDFLVPDKKGELVTAPSTSPENLYVTDKGYVGQSLYGGTADLAMIRELFNDYLKSAEVLNIDPELQQKVKDALAKLHPYQIGKAGNLQEWYHDWKDNDPHHRHLSHLFAAYPGYSITTSKNKDLADAVRKSLEIRTNEGTGWAITWRINLWARMQNGERAYDAVKKMLHYVGNSSQIKMGGGGVYSNLFCAHPPFQIDGNFGGGAGISEMLLQSHQGFIELLPALPEEWKNGSFSGLVARGGYLVDAKWSNGDLTYLKIFSREGGTCKVKFKDKIKAVKTNKNGAYVINFLK